MDQDLKALAMKGYDAISSHDLSSIDDLISPNFVEHEELTSGGNDWDSTKKEFLMLFDAFPDLTVHVDDMVQAGDKVWLRGRFTGTHKGSFLGMAPTGKSIDVRIMDCLRFEDGKCVEHWGVTDNMKMMQQLGMMPEEMSV